MAYTPNASFVLSAAEYTPSAAFSFDDAPQQLEATFNVTLDDVTGHFVAYHSPVADLTVQLDDAISKFNVEVSQPGGTDTSVQGYTPTAAFVFTVQDYQPSAAFIFETEIISDGVLQCTFNAKLDDVKGHFQVSYYSNLVVFAAQLDDMTAEFDAEYDYNVHRLTLAQIFSNVEDSNRVNIKNCALRKPATPRSINTASEQQAATVSTLKMPLFSQPATPLKITRCGMVDDGTALSKKVTAAVQAMTPIPMALASQQQQAQKQQQKTCSVAEQMTPVYTDPIHIVAQDTGSGVKTERHIRIVDDPNPYTPGAHFVLDNADDADGHFVFNVTQGQIEFIRQQFLGIVSSQVNTSWQYATPLYKKTCSPVEPARRPPPGTSIRVDRPREPPVIPPGQSSFIIPEQTTYIMQHNLSVTLLDLTPINISSVELSLDVDSFAWSFSAALADKSQVPLLKQTGTDPVQLIITINGLTPWKVIVERTERTRQFGKQVISLKGRGLSALLSQPYQQATSATQGSDLSVQQIADLQLPAGWTNNWTAQTWLVPGGAYSHQNRTPIQAVMDIARNIGAIVVPATESQVLNIRPRYPVLPWQFDAAAPDIIIPESAITELVERPVVESQINGVYVHGSETGGQLGWCRLNGTAGDRLAATESNTLLTDSIALRALGERILAGQYTQPAIQSMTLPIDGVTFPLIAIGQLIETTLTGSGTIRGIVNSISISANFAKVRQTIQVGEETANNWTLFKDLLPADPLLVATLSSTDGKTAIMTLLDNGVVRVRGTGTVGSKYYIRSGKIDGEAPNQVQSEIVV